MGSRKGPSPQKLKQIAAQRRPYTPTQEMNYEKCECDPGAAMPPGWVLDLLADRKMDGGYRLVVPRGPRAGQSNICDRHFLTRSANGTCSGCLGDFA
jgi:hypothetical protein